MLRTLLPLALIATAGTAYAQTMSTPAPTTSAPPQTMSTPATPAQPMASSIQRTTTTGQPMSTGNQPMSTTGQPTAGSAAGSVDANGQPVIGRNDWVRQPGDRQGSGQGSGMQSPSRDPNMAAAPARARAGGAVQPGPDGTFRDEYGFRYDAQGNRIDGRGRLIAPPMSRQ